MKSGYGVMELWSYEENKSGYGVMELWSYEEQVRAVKELCGAERRRAVMKLRSYEVMKSSYGVMKLWSYEVMESEEQLWSKE